MGQEGYATQGDIFLDDERIAFWSQDGDGGCDTIYMAKKYSEGKFLDALRKLNQDKHIILEFNGVKKAINFDIGFDIDSFMNDLLELEEFEKEYSKYRYKGYNMLICISNYEMKALLPLTKEYLAITDEQIKEMIKPNIENFKQKYGSDGLKINIFRDFKDFNRGKSLNLDDIYNFQKLEDVYMWDKLILKDKMISKEELQNFPESEKQKFLNMEVIASNKDDIYYEKNYFLEIPKNDKNRDEKEMEEEI